MSRERGEGKSNGADLACFVAAQIIQRSQQWLKGLSGAWDSPLPHHPFSRDGLIGKRFWYGNFFCDPPTSTLHIIHMYVHGYVLPITSSMKVTRMDHVGMLWLASDHLFHSCLHQTSEFRGMGKHIQSLLPSLADTHTVSSNYSDSSSC